MIIDFYTKSDCLLCIEAQTTLELLQQIYSFEINICDIHEREDWLEKYFLHIPVVDIDSIILYGEEVEWDRLEAEIKTKIKKDCIK